MNMEKSINSENAKKVLEKVLNISKERNKKYSELLSYDEEQALSYALTLFDEVDRLKEMLKYEEIQKSHDRGLVHPKEYAYQTHNELMNEISRLKEGLELNFQKGRQIEIERYEKEIARLKDRVGELENTIETYIKDNDDFGGLFNHWFYRKDVANAMINKYKSKLKAVREISIAEIFVILKNTEFRLDENTTMKDQAILIKSKIDETIGEGGL